MTKLTPDQMILRAATIATKAHDGHKRKDGAPYISHPIRVATQVEGKIAGAVALLHDVVEDTNVTLEDLRDAGFTNQVIDAVDAITKRPGEKYSDFIDRISRNPLAIEVKIADIRDNLEDQSALDPEEAEFLTKRYTKALEILEANL